MRLCDAAYRWSQEVALRLYFKEIMANNSPNIRFHTAGYLNFNIGPLEFEMNGCANNTFNISAALDGENQVKLVTAKNVEFSDTDKIVDLFRRLIFFLLYGQDFFDRRTTKVHTIMLQSCSQIVRASLLVDRRWEEPEGIFSRFY